MVSVPLSAELPAVVTAQATSLAEAQAWCRRLARSHYENFLVATCVVPRSLRQHFYNLYAYCRVADDLADESENLEQSQMALDRWQTMLEECYAGRASHPVFVALAQTIQDFSIPIEPFSDLLVAFRRDQVQRRYETVDELLGYCRSSANPVGRLVLHLGRCHGAATCELSDSICTGLQLANFCQDVARDLKLGRIYIPQESIDAAGYSEYLLADSVENEAFVRLMQTEVDRAESYLRNGLPLVELVPDWLAVDVTMFIEGGLEVLREIRRDDYRVLSSRPTVSKRRQLSLLARTWLRRRFSRSRRRAA